MTKMTLCYSRSPTLLPPRSPTIPSSRSPTLPSTRGSPTAARVATRTSSSLLVCRALILEGCSSACSLFRPAQAHCPLTSPSRSVIFLDASEPSTRTPPPARAAGNEPSSGPRFDLGTLLRRQRFALPIPATPAHGSRRFAQLLRQPPSTSRDVPTGDEAPRIRTPIRRAKPSSPAISRAALRSCPASSPDRERLRVREVWGRIEACDEGWSASRPHWIRSGSPGAARGLELDGGARVEVEGALGVEGSGGHGSGAVARTRVGD